jgi:hypothetical protein
MNNRIRVSAVAFVVGVVACVATPAAFAAAGKALFVSGSVTLEGKSKKDLKVGDPVDLGDIVVTGARSRAQLLMADGARIALRASSRFRIDELQLPTNVQQPALAVAVASSGKSVGTLLKGGFSTRDGAIGKNNPSAYEMRTPIGTLGIRGTYYTAVFCRGDCADAPGLPAGQPIPDGLYLAVDEGTITFNGRGLSLTLTAPRFEYIPLDTSDPQQLFDPPAFLRNDGAGAFQVAGRTVRIAAGNEANSAASALGNDRRSPEEAPRMIASVADNREQPGKKPEQDIVATSPLGRSVDLLDPQLPFDSKTSLAVSVPGSSLPAFASSSTGLSNTLTFNAGGSLLQFNAPLGAGATAVPATYLSGTAALLDFGSNGASGIRWGRWATGAASVSTINGAQPISLQGSSLHWIVGPTFEVPPVLPVSGSTNFVLAGGTSPTDDLGHAGILGAGTLVADFTAQQVSTALSLDVNGYNWFATGSGPLVAGTNHFNGTYTNVLVDGRLAGTGAFSGFLSAGALASDQLSGAGLSYWLNLQQLGTVSGVAAFVPGAMQPLVPPVVIRDVAYAVGSIDNGNIGGGAATNTRAQLAFDASGNLTAFDAPVPRAPSGTLGIGVATNADTGIDASTGIRWGRWEGGNIDVTTPPSASASTSLNNEALHWIAGNESGAPPTLPQTGTATYTLVGNTNPTDTLGNVGTLGAMSFTADFTNRTVASAMTLNMAGLTWYASGAATYNAGSQVFTGSYTDVRVQNFVTGQGSFSGFFTSPRIGSGTTAGAGLSYNLSEPSGQLGVISGVAAFQQGGQGSVVTPPTQQSRDIAMISPDTGALGTVVTRAAANGYVLDSGFNLTSLPGLTNVDPKDPARYDIGTNTLVESGVSPLVMLRWGRWAAGDANVTDLANGATYAVNLKTSSLHWIESADSAAPPVIPQFGNYTYALIGATSPTDHAGNVGVLNNATLNADFTNQVVAATFDISISNFNVIATGGGFIGAQFGLPAHQFAGTINGGTISPIQGTPQGSFSGFFSGPGGSVPGVPGGAGLSYTISDQQGVLVVDGVAAFKGP